MPIRNDVYKGQFPDQYLSIEKLLNQEFLNLEDYIKEWGPEGPDMEPLGHGTIRYFHISFNNMVVSSRPD
jgi:hypothetical protein